MPRSLTAWIAAVTACLAAALAPATARASGTVERADGGRLLVLTSTTPIDDRDEITAGQSGDTVTFSAAPGGYVAAAGSDCTVTPVPGDGSDQIDCTNLGSVVRVIVHAGDGRDFVQAQGVVLDTELDGGPGNDTVRGGSSQVAPITLLGGPGRDQVGSLHANATVDGGPGVDLLFSGPGDEHFIGGSGFDIVSYDDRDVGIRASIGDASVDGDPLVNERDIIDGDVEGLAGGSGNDRLTGDDRTNYIAGAGGNDEIDGGGGGDVLDGQEGNDTLTARDGVSERVACGPGDDRAVTDDFDSVSSCETVDSSPDLQPDRDGDGVLKPADCNDLDASIRPGAFDAPGNGVDENCDGADAVDFDRDRDGFMPPLDCNDGNAAIRPGTEELPGNAVDENCDGIAAPLSKLAVFVSLAIQPVGSRSRLVGLVVADLDGGERIELRCRGRHCPFTRLRRTVAAGVDSVKFDKALRRAKLPAGATLTVTVTRSDGVAKIVVLTMRKRKAPRRAQRCVPPPGATVEPC